MISIKKAIIRRNTNYLVDDLNLHIGNVKIYEKIMRCDNFSICILFEDRISKRFSKEDLFGVDIRGIAIPFRQDLINEALHLIYKNANIYLDDLVKNRIITMDEYKLRLRVLNGLIPKTRFFTSRCNCIVTFEGKNRKVDRNNINSEINSFHKKCINLNNIKRDL